MLFALLTIVVLAIVAIVCVHQAYTSHNDALRLSDKVDAQAQCLRAWKAYADKKRHDMGIMQQRIEHLESIDHATLRDLEHATKLVNKLQLESASWKQAAIDQDAKVAELLDEQAADNDHAGQYENYLEERLADCHVIIGRATCPF